MASLYRYTDWANDARFGFRPDSRAAGLAAAPGPGAVPYRSCLGVMQPAGQASWPAAAAEFAVGGMVITVRPAASADLDAHVSRERKQRKRAGWSCGHPQPSPVAGYPDGRLLPMRSKRARGAAPQVRLFTLAGAYLVTVWADEAQAGLAQSLGPVLVEPPVPPLVTPVVRVPGTGGPPPAELLVLTEGAVRLAVQASAGPVTASTDDYAAAALSDLAARLPGTTLGSARRDVFLGGWPCTRVTAVAGGERTPVRSEYWWVGTAAGRGYTFFGAGTKSIIDAEQACRLRDLVVAIPPG